MINPQEETTGTGAGLEAQPQVLALPLAQPRLTLPTPDLEVLAGLLKGAKSRALIRSLARLHLEASTKEPSLIQRERWKSLGHALESLAESQPFPQE